MNETKKASHADLIKKKKKKAWLGVLKTDACALLISTKYFLSWSKILTVLLHPASLGPYFSLNDFSFPFQ